MSLKTDIQDLKRRLGSIVMPRCMVLFRHDPHVNEVLFPMGPSEGPLCNTMPSSPDVCLECQRVKTGRKMIAEAVTTYKGPEDHQPQDWRTPHCYLIVTRNRVSEVINCEGCTHGGRDERTRYPTLPDCSSCPITRRTITDVVILAEGRDLVKDLSA
jgi:hypothetical protein